MKRTRIKICGVRDADTAATACAAGADAIGLVFIPGSPRQVDEQQARLVVNAISAFTEPIALFVDAPARRIRETAQRLGIATVQLHGTESPEMAAELAPLRVIKTIGFEPDSLAANVRRWQRSCKNLAGILIDTPPARDAPASRRGGSGQGFDLPGLRATLETIDGFQPILAGGLTAENVGAAITTVRPSAVDVSSGVESHRGIKDAVLIERFCQAVRETDQR